MCKKGTRPESLGKGWFDFALQPNTCIFVRHLNGLDEQIYNIISLLTGFDSGTKPTILGKQKPVLLADALYNQALRPIKMDRRCLN